METIANSSAELRPLFPSQKEPHLAQGTEVSPRGSQDCVSSRGGQSSSSPTESCSTRLFRVRLPLASLRSVQALEQALHSAHSLSWQALGRRQGCTVAGRSVSVHRLSHTSSSAGCRATNTQTVRGELKYNRNLKVRHRRLTRTKPGRCGSVDPWIRFPRAPSQLYRRPH